jgi:adenosylhomocysteine nucleosidase
MTGRPEARGPTAIVAPLAAELAGVLRATRGRRRLRLAAAGESGGDREGRRRPRRGWNVTLGRLGGEEVALMATGDGAAAAGAGLEALVAALRPRRLLALGVAGGLTPGLAAGTLVAARRVIAAGPADGPIGHGPDETWLARALACGAVAGTAVAVDWIAADPAAKQAALQRALATAGPAGTAGGVRTIVTADLESAAYARVAVARSLPYLVVRVVLDPAEETLPLDFASCRAPGGGVSHARVVLAALARPASIAGLWRLRGRVRRAAETLAAFAERLVEAPATSETPVAPGARQAAGGGRRRG